MARGAFEPLILAVLILVMGMLRPTTRSRHPQGRFSESGAKGEFNLQAVWPNEKLDLSELLSLIADASQGHSHV